MKALLYKDLLLLWKDHRGTILYLAVVAVLSYRIADGQWAAINGIGLLLILILVPLDLDAHWLEVLPYVGILWVTSVISAFLAADQYRKAWTS